VYVNEVGVGVEMTKKFPFTPDPFEYPITAMGVPGTRPCVVDVCTVTVLVGY
jgi:hypothetical protein